jgi:hypothetical protein
MVYADINLTKAYTLKSFNRPEYSKQRCNRKFFQTTLNRAVLLHFTTNNKVFASLRIQRIERCPLLETKQNPENTRAFQPSKLKIWRYLILAFGFGNVGIGIKMMLSYLEVWVYFPAFPIFLDWILVISSGLCPAFLVATYPNRKRIGNPN